MSVLLNSMIQLENGLARNEYFIMKKKPEYNGLDIVQSDNIIIKHKNNVTVTDSCPFWDVGRSCKIAFSIECSYGLTDIRTTKDCPLRKGTIRVSRKFEWVETDL